MERVWWDSDDHITDGVAVDVDDDDDDVHVTLATIFEFNGICDISVAI